MKRNTERKNRLQELKEMTATSQPLNPPSESQREISDNVEHLKKILKNTNNSDEINSICPTNSEGSTECESVHMRVRVNDSLCQKSQDSSPEQAVEVIGCQLPPCLDSLVSKKRLGTPSKSCEPSQNRTQTADGESNIAQTTRTGIRVRT